jgi:hypothetical protein
MTWGRRNVPKRSSEFLFAINRPWYQFVAADGSQRLQEGFAKLMDNVFGRHRDGGPLHVRRRRDLCHSQ